MTNRKQQITDPAQLPAFLTVREVAQLIRRQPRTIYEMVEKGLIPFSRPPGTRSITFEKQRILEWMRVNN